jgi:TPR repeat protein
VLIILITAVCIFACSKASDETSHAQPTIGNAEYNLTLQQIQDFKVLAEKGDGEAAFRLARYYNFLTADVQQGLHWLIKAAKNGHGLSQFELAKCYIEDEHCRRDINKARYWLKKAATNNVHDAEVYLSFMLSKEERIKAIKKAEQGDGASAYLLRNYYYYIKGDNKSAEIWMKRTRELGHSTQYPFGAK